MNRNSESDILNELVVPDLSELPLEAVNALLALRFKQTALDRMNQLAEKNRGAAISAGEKEEMENYQRVGNFLSFLKAKARLSIHQRDSAP